MNCLRCILAFIAVTCCANAEITSGHINFDGSSSLNNSQVKIDPEQRSGHVIARSFYGSHLDAAGSFPRKKFVDELQLGMIRVGGNAYDVYNWKTSKALVNERESLLSLYSYPEIARKLREYGTEGIYQINLTGYMPVMEGNRYVLKREFNAKEIQEMIIHLNGKLKLNMKHFSMGNEFAQWHETHSHIWPSEDGISADEYIDRYIETVIAARGAQEQVNGDPNSIKIWGPEISASWLDWNTGNISHDCEYTEIAGQVSCHYGGGRFTHFVPYFLHRVKAAQNDRVINPKGYKLLDYMSIHYYPNFRKDINDINSIVTNESGEQRVAEILEATRLLHDPSYVNTIDLSSFKNISPNIFGRMKQWTSEHYPSAKLVINEYALDSDYRTVNYHPIIRPLYMSDMIGIAIKNHFSFFNRFILNSNEYSPVPWALIQEGREKTDLFYMYKLITNFFKGEVIAANDNMGDEINSYALRDKNEIRLLVVNKSKAEKHFDILISSQQIEKKVTTYKAPAWSSSIIIFNLNPKNGDVVKVARYGASEMNILPGH